MKNPLLFILVALAVTCPGAKAESFGVPDPGAPQHFSQRIRDSDHATFTAYNAKETGPGRLLTVNDCNWMERFAKILSDAVYEPKDHLLAISPPVTFFSRQGKPVLSIQMLPGNILRLDATDYAVGAKTCTLIRNLLNELSTPPAPAASDAHGAP